MQGVYLPATTIMTGNTIQVTLDGIDLLLDASDEQRSIISTRFWRTFGNIATFAAGCAAAAALYAWAGFWCLCVPVFVAILTATIRVEN